MWPAGDFLHHPFGRSSPLLPFLCLPNTDWRCWSGYSDEIKCKLYIRGKIRKQLTSVTHSIMANNLLWIPPLLTGDAECAWSAMPHCPSGLLLYCSSLWNYTAAAEIDDGQHLSSLFVSTHSLSRRSAREYQCQMSHPVTFTQIGWGQHLNGIVVCIYGNLLPQAQSGCHD